MSIDFSEEWFERLCNILEASRAKRPSSKELDEKFLNEQHDDIMQHLYEIRYLCEEHNESPLAKMIEKIMIEASGKLVTEQ